MSDYSSSLPTRTQTNGDIVAFLADGTTNSQLLAIDPNGRITIKLDDGTGNAITSQINGAQRALDIGINVAGVQIDPRAVGQYNSTLPTVTNGSYTPLQTNANGVLLTSPETDLMPATVNITAQDLASTSTPQFNQTWYSGTPTAGSVAAFTLSSNETGLLEITGTWTGSLQVEVSVDGGTNWIAHSVHLLGSAIFTSSFTGNVMGSINLAAKTNIRVRATAAWTGTATVKLNLSINESSVYVANAIKLVDASSSTSTTQANIVPASTPASTSNTAIVVGLSPNSPLPAGTNLLGSINQGTSPWVTSDLADGSLTGGTAGSKSLAAGGVFTTATGLSTPLTAGQQAAIQVDSNGRIIVGSIVGSLPSGTNLLGGTNVYVNGALASSTNPVPVTITTTTPGTAVQFYSTSANLSVGGSATFTYTVAASHTFNLQRIFASASGKIKAVVAVSGTTIFVGFNSTANPNIDITVISPPLVAAAGTVTLTITNEDKAQFDVYGTIEGNQN